MKHIAFLLLAILSLSSCSMLNGEDKDDRHLLEPPSNTEIPVQIITPRI